jgi:type IV/VI secretion system ImpK/VasF family protein
MNHNDADLNSEQTLKTTIESVNDLATADGDRELLADAQSSYHSQAFEVNLAMNPLVAAAAPLLTIATQLREQRQPPELILLHSSLSHEIKAFENKTRVSGYRTHIILAARYFLCALLDEIILNTPWGNNSRWEQHNLLRSFQRESAGDERFFMILERSCEDSKLHMDLLELGYLCLSLGYEGKYRKKSGGQQELGLIIDRIYHLIRDNRGEFSKLLLISPTTKTPTTTTHSRLPPIWLALIITLFALLGIYVPYHIKLDHLVAPVDASLQSMISDQHTVDDANE